jgi:hypothetical protein
MPKALTTNAVITCPHGGVGTSMPLPPPRIVTVNGGSLLLDGDQGTLSCTNVVPCVGYSLRSMGLNATTVQGRKVMLVSDLIQSQTGFPLTVVETHPVTDKTLPGTPPASGAVVPPELEEDDTPTVSVMPGELPFSIAGFGSSGAPPALPFVFTLTSSYPLRWTLFQVPPPPLPPPPGTAAGDVTAGVPGAVIVAPAGGVWAGSPLVVSVTVQGAYAATLAPGVTHSFVLTAVNKRGFSAFAQANVKVST